MIPANVDCSDKGNVTQARYEAHRCASDNDKAAWFNKWAEALLEYKSGRDDKEAHAAAFGIADEILALVEDLKEQLA